MSFYKQNYSLLEILRMSCVLDESDNMLQYLLADVTRSVNEQSVKGSC